MSAETWPFQMIAGYAIEGTLGQGGMGRVYRGRHQALDRPVAVKVLDPALLAKSPSAAARFLREARLAAKIDHPNVVRVLDCGEEGGHHYLVMELVEGESLADRLAREGPLPWRDVLGWARQTAVALGVAAQREIIHRDIKPGNLLLAKDGTLKVADLGLAKTLEADVTAITAEPNQILGTPLYMSPEQCFRPREIDARSDIYSLGATVFELIEGQVPFSGPAYSVLTQHREAERPGLARVAASSPVQRLVAQMMAIDPAVRPQSAAELIERIDRVLAGEEPTAVAETRRLAVATLAAAVAVMLVVVLVAIVAGPRSGPGDPAPEPGPVAMVGGPSDGDDDDDDGADVVEDDPVGARNDRNGIYGDVEELSDGRWRVRWTFDDPREGEDFEPVDAVGTHVEVRDGRLHIWWDESIPEEEHAPIAIAIVRQFRVDRLDFRGEIITGDHLNWYIDVAWQPQEWLPERGLAGIHRWDGRLMLVHGEEHPVPGSAEARTGHVYEVAVTATDEAVRWSVDGVEHRVAARRVMATDGALGLGAWDSHVAIDDVVMLGEPGPR